MTSKAQTFTATQAAQKNFKRASRTSFSFTATQAAQKRQKIQPKFA